MAKIYARLVNATVVELISIPDIANIATMFTPELVTTMVLGNGSTTIGMTWDGSQFHAPVAPSPTPTDTLNAKIGAGIQIVSTGTPSLNGTYALDQTTLNNLGNLLAAIGAGIGLPGGGAAVALADTSGAPHSFTATQVKDLEGAIATYVFNLRVSWNLLSAGQAPNWPSLPVTIP